MSSEKSCVNCANCHIDQIFVCKINEERSTTNGYGAKAMAENCEDYQVKK